MIAKKVYTFNKNKVEIEEENGYLYFSCDENFYFEVNLSKVLIDKEEIKEEIIKLFNFKESFEYEDDFPD